MARKSRPMGWRIGRFGLLFCIVLLMGCRGIRGEAPVEKTATLSLKKVVVAGFTGAMGQGEKPRVIRGPLSGSIYAAGPVTQAATATLTDQLFEMMVATEQYQLISPDQARGVFSSILETNRNLEMDQLGVIKEIGAYFQADAVMAGTIYRWREREGNDYAVTEPASVAFDLHMVRPHDGAILWKGRFDKTQQSLSENLLDWDLFTKGKGRWLTAEKLAQYGLEMMMKRLHPRRAPAEEEPRL